MGRSSGFIAMHASLSSGQIDVCLIPEVCKHWNLWWKFALLHMYRQKITIWMKVSFTLDGEHGVLQHLEHLLNTKGFCVICVAEGAGQVSWHCGFYFKNFCDWRGIWMNYEIWGMYFFDSSSRIYCKSQMQLMLQEMRYLVTLVSTCNRRYPRLELLTHTFASSIFEVSIRVGCDLVPRWRLHLVPGIRAKVPWKCTTLE